MTSKHYDLTNPVRQNNRLTLNQLREKLSRDSPTNDLPSWRTVATTLGVSENAVYRYRMGFPIGKRTLAKITAILAATPTTSIRP